MRLLVITQKADRADPILGFFHRWLLEFAKQFEQVTIICLYEGVHDLPLNVRVFSLGKEKGESKFKYIYRFYKYIFKERKNYDAVFVHMNPIYTVLGGIFWKIWGKKVALWYTHRQVDLKLRLAVLVSHLVFTASEKSLNIKNRKVRIMGHGIDTDLFKGGQEKQKGDVVNILHVGRITAIKNLEVLLEAAAILKEKWNRIFKITLIGSPATPVDLEYKKRLENVIKKNSLETFVSFVGSVGNNKIPDHYREADITVNLAPTGGIDKAVLESWSTGTPCFVSNEAFREYFGNDANIFIFKQGDEKDLAEKIVKFLSLPDKKEIKKRVSDIVRQKSDVVSLIKEISSIIKT